MTPDLPMSNDEEWLMKKAAEEDGCCVSAGGLIARMKDPEVGCICPTCGGGIVGTDYWFDDGDLHVQCESCETILDLDFTDFTPPQGSITDGHKEYMKARSIVKPVYDKQEAEKARLEAKFNTFTMILCWAVLASLVAIFVYFTR